MIIGVILLQGLVVFGAENNLRKSSSGLRKSNDKVSSRSCSQELAKKATVPAFMVASIYYNYPGGDVVLCKGAPHDLRPYPYLPGEFPGQ